MMKFGKVRTLLAGLMTAVLLFGMLSAFPASAASSALEKRYDPIMGQEEGSSNYITISTAEELSALKLTEGRTFYVELTADIDMSGKSFTPLNASLPQPGDKKFDPELGNVVIFEGNGHTISNLSVTTQNAHVGLFAHLYDGSEVRNLKFVNADLTTDGWPYAVGAVAGCTATRVSIYNVSVDKTSSMTSSNGIAGGIVGMMLEQGGRATDATGANLSHCINEAAVKGRTRVGGIVGSYQSVDPLTVRYCANRGSISNVQNVSTYVGGILGCVLASNSGSHPVSYNGKAYLLDHCVNTGTLTANHTAETYYTGGMIGDMGDNASETTVTMKACADSSTRIHSGAGGVTVHGAFFGKCVSVTRTMTDCVAVGKAYTQICANDASYTSDGAKVATDATSEAMAIIVAVNGKLATAGNIPTANLSAAGGKLSLRMKLTVPYGFMAITTLYDGTKAIPTAQYADRLSDYGFVFLKSDEAVDMLTLRETGKRVSGKPYSDASRFCVTYDFKNVTELGTSLCFAAYVEIDGCLFLSDIRTLRPIDPVRTLSADTSETISAEEHDAYLSMITRYENLGGGTATAEKKSVKVATYNIYHCADITKIDSSHDEYYWAFTDEIVNSDNIARVIQRNGIEICGLQETTAYADTYGDGNTVQAERIAKKLAELTGKTWYWGFAPGKIGGYANDPDGAFGNSIVSQYPITEIECYGIGTSSYNRCMLIAELDVAGSPLTMLVSHFDNTSAAERQKGVDAVREIKSTITTPTVLMGDFNAAPEKTGGTYNGLKALYTPTAASDDSVPYSFPSDAPRTTYDYILHSPELSSTELHVDKTALYSDHLPVIVRIVFP